VQNFLPMRPQAADLVEIRSEDGAGATVHLQGAHVLSWLPACGRQQLYLSRAAVFQAGTAVRGGVPVVFPQFSDHGPLPKHGFARNVRWELVKKAHGRAVFRLQDTETTRSVWPHAFELQLEVTVQEQSLELWLQVRNTGAEPFSFMAALHSYLALDDATQSTVKGLKGQRFTDAVTGVEHTDSEQVIRFGTDVDRLYHETEQCSVTVAGHSISQEGFADTAVWNPGPLTGAKLKDLEQPTGWLNFVCVEAAQVAQPVTLAAGEVWRGGQQLVAST
jgi:glucose-6-phosphate 1-epimerase